jgi:hypothetical protein
VCAWVFRVAHNLGLDVRAKERFRPLEPELEAALRDGRRGVEMELIERQKMTQLGEAWKTLSPQQRNAFTFAPRDCATGKSPRLWGSAYRPCGSFSAGRSSASRKPWQSTGTLPVAMIAGSG